MTRARGRWPAASRPVLPPRYGLAWHFPVRRIANPPARVHNSGMKVLGIESSCDETGVAVYDTGLSGAAALRAHAVYSQIALHADFGGMWRQLTCRYQYR